MTFTGSRGEVLVTHVPEVDALRIGVGIATRGRGELLVETVSRLRQQTHPANCIFVCGADDRDVAALQPASDLEILLSRPGLPAQRNRIILQAADYDILIFIDDDFIPAIDYIEHSVAAFRSDPTVVVTTGHVIADGAVGPGLSIETARRVLAQDRERPVPPDISPAFNGYGCNMGIRLQPMFENDLRFDERLPLYAWFEDVDLTRRLGRHGRIVKVHKARGVHLGIKVGRTSGTRLGYSQVANPIYLACKGVYPWARVVRGLSRHLLVNCVKSIRPEPYIDRRGRLRGNMRAIGDLLRGRLRPERILDF